MFSKLCSFTQKPWLPKEIDRSASFTFAPKRYNNELLKSFDTPLDIIGGKSSFADKQTDLVLANTLYEHCFDKQVSRNDLLMEMSKDYLRTIDEKEALLFSNSSREENLLKKLDVCYKQRDEFMKTMHKKCAELTKQLEQKQNEIADLKSCMSKSDMEKFKHLKGLLNEYKSAVDTANVHEERIKLAKVVVKYNKLIQYFDNVFKTMKQQIARAKEQGVFICTESGVIERQDKERSDLYRQLCRSQNEIKKLYFDHENEVKELRLKHANEVEDTKRNYEEHIKDVEQKNNEKMRMMEKRIKELENENIRVKNEISQKNETIGKLHLSTKRLDQTVLDLNDVKQKFDRAVNDREAWEQTCRKLNKKCQILRNGVNNKESDPHIQKENEENVDLMKMHLESTINVQNELREEVKFFKEENNKMNAKLKKSADNELKLNEEIANLQKQLKQIQQDRSHDLNLTDEYIKLFRNTSNYDLEVQDGRFIFLGGDHDHSGMELKEIDSGVFFESDDEQEDEVEDALMVGKRFASL